MGWPTICSRDSRTSFGGRVPFDDPARVVDGDDAVQSRLENRPLERFTGAELPLDGLTLGDFQRVDIDVASLGHRRELAGKDTRPRLQLYLHRLA